MKLNIAFLLTLLVTITSSAQVDHTKYLKITSDIKERIKKAIPKDFVQPAKNRKIVVFSKSSRYVHGATSICNEMLKQLAVATEAFEITFNDDPATYTSEYLKQFDAILVNNASHIQKAFKEENREALMNFIKSGKGFVGIHAASDGGYNEWPEYSEMVGGYFKGHPWNRNGQWAMEVNDTEHPINKPFKKKLFTYKEEIFLQSGPYKKENMHTLIKIDPVNDPLKKKVKHDREYPISWVKKYGNGKVFYTSFGHNADSYYDSIIVDHMMRGIQFALGDLKGPITLGK